MLKPYRKHYISIIFLTGIISALQLYFTRKEYSLINYLNPFLSQLLGPAIFAAFMIMVFWYLGRKITAFTVFITYLIIWAVMIMVNIVFLIIYGQVINYE
ncbi:MAG: hypothetical protein ACK40G_15545 [Cytophagaceae bacterium]